MNDMGLSKMKLDWKFFSLAVFSLLAFGCYRGEQQTPPQFELLRKDATGLDFENVQKQSLEFNVFNYMYFFNGGGVAAGDFNNDGLVDLYFTSNMGPNKLFLNEGPKGAGSLKFRDVTEQAGVAGLEGGWSTGVTVADVNNDGLLDIYVNQVGEYQIIKGRNQLFICKGIENGVPEYEDEAIPYGLDFVCFGTQAVFFDYDLDGDLDLFQLNHSLHNHETFGQRKDFMGTKHPLSGDRLMRNDGERFTEVTMQAGINSSVIGYGLGVVIGDVNLDGWPDIYVGNDFHENDYLYINQRNGTFKEELTEQMMHCSNYSMGVDMADINNDGWNDIVSLDMLAEDPVILKSSMGEFDYGTYMFRIGYGYHYQFSRNNLQLNNGDGTFSEIGLQAGIHATDWSWAPLLVDFDHDGYKDLFISNGIPRRMNDIDYINYRKSDEEFTYRTNLSEMTEENLKVVEQMPRIKLPNKFYHNSGKLTFQDIGQQVKNGLTTYSNGAIYADLDNDGDLDIVVNNIEDEPFVYKNKTIENGGLGGNYIALKLKGAPKNDNAIGAKAVVFKKGQKLLYENFPVRGFQSCLPAGLHIGLGDTTQVDSIVLIWPDGSYQQLDGFAFNQLHTISWRQGLPKYHYENLKNRKPHLAEFEDVTAKIALDFQHKENPFVEFHRERLIPHMVSSEGPALSVGDINGDGLEDVFFGSSKRNKSALYFQKPDGSFILKTPDVIANDSLFEDVDAVFADLDNDGDLDLAIAAGGNEYSGKDEAMKQRAYLNDGKGNFRRMDFEGVYMTAACVLPADFNKDGLMDLFFGARAVPWKYGITPASMLLQNMGNGAFENVTAKIGGGLQEAGMVKNGEWTDIDKDGDPDLVLAIEWEPITIFLNDDGRFKKTTFDERKGWWNFVLPHDFDGDGDIDLLAGNLGENSKLKPTPEHPVKLYVNDFDDNEQLDPILSYHLGGREIPFANYKDVTAQLPGLKKKFLFAKDFAKASLTELLGKEKLAKSVVREVNFFKSVYYENLGNGKFEAYDLPAELQFSTLNAACLSDLEGDGNMEVLLGGNFYDCNIEMGRYDANYGNVLRISKGGRMEVFPLGSLQVKGQVRRIEPVKSGGRTLFILAKNNDKPQVIKVITG
jgi:hypothetical protein